MVEEKEADEMRDDVEEPEEEKQNEGGDGEEEEGERNQAQDEITLFRDYCVQEDATSRLREVSAETIQKMIDMLQRYCERLQDCSFGSSERREQICHFFGVSEEEESSLSAADICVAKQNQFLYGVTVLKEAAERCHLFNPNPRAHNRTAYDNYTKLVNSLRTLAVATEELLLYRKWRIIGEQAAIGTLMFGEEKEDKEKNRENAVYLFNPDRKPIAQVLHFLHEQIRLNNFRRYEGYAYRQVIILRVEDEDGCQSYMKQSRLEELVRHNKSQNIKQTYRQLARYETQSWEQVCKINPNLVQLLVTVANNKEWEAMVERGGAKLCGLQLEQCNEHDFKTLKKNRYHRAYLNLGMYLHEKEKKVRLKIFGMKRESAQQLLLTAEPPVFEINAGAAAASFSSFGKNFSSSSSSSSSEPYFSFAADKVASCVQFYEREFVPRNCFTTHWTYIQTPTMEKILDHQGFTSYTKLWLFGLIGALLFPTTRWNPQIAILFFGVANSGKSTLLDNVIALLYHMQDVGILNANTQVIFFLASVIYKLIVMCTELVAGIGISLAEFLQMTAAGRMAANIKHANDTVHFLFDKPTCWGGNELPRWNSKRGNVVRRFASFTFANTVTDVDNNIAANLENELAAIIVKCTLAFFEIEKKVVEEGGFWKNAPKFLQMSRVNNEMALDPIYAFLKKSSDIAHKKNSLMPLEALEKLFNAHVRTNRIQVNDVKRDQWVEALGKMYNDVTIVEGKRACGGRSERWGIWVQNLECVDLGTGGGGGSVAPRAGAASANYDEFGGGAGGFADDFADDAKDNAEEEEEETHRRGGSGDDTSNVKALLEESERWEEFIPSNDGNGEVKYFVEKCKMSCRNDYEQNNGVLLDASRYKQFFKQTHANTTNPEIASLLAKLDAHSKVSG